jgi:CHASE1-domain containing sensor protein
MRALMLFILVIVSLSTQANPMFKSTFSSTPAINQEEPGTLSMMLAGLGLVVYIARRRLHANY